MLSNQTRTFITILLPVLTLLLGWQIGVHAQQREMMDMQKRLELLYTGGGTGSGAVLGDPEKEVDPALMWGVWRILQSHYIYPEKLVTQQMLYGAVSGMVKAIGDPYTVFMTPPENTEFRDSLSGHLQGIGAQLADREGKIVVVAPLKGSPAMRAGLLPEDVIVQVDELDVTDKGLEEVVSHIRGPKGTKVKITVLRKDAADLMTFTITRDDITIPSTEYEVKQTATGSVGYLIINQFGSETVREVQGIVKDINPSELKGLIVDLRFNGGGFLDGATDLVSIFLKEGKVVSVEGRGTEPQRHYVSGNVVLPDIPLVVMINQASASASEIMAGALQDHKRATIVGMKSFGKGTVQEVVDLPGGSSLRVTIARWLTPNGRDLGKEGVVPDIVIDRTNDDTVSGRDPQLQAALDWLTMGKKPISTGTGSAVKE